MYRVDGRARLLKDVAREHGASDCELWRAYRRVCADLSHGARDYQDLDAYVAAGRDALVRALRGPRAMAGYWLGEMFERRIKEARLLSRLNGAKTHPKARAPRVAAQRRGHGAQVASGALGRVCVSLNVDLDEVRAVFTSVSFYRII
jgi:hypothetical protein